MKRWIVPVVAVVAVLVAAVVFRRELAAWFGGERGGATSESVRAQAGNLTIEAALRPDPPREKGNTLVITVADAAGKAVEGAAVTVTHVMPAMGSMPEMRGTASVSSKGGGRYEARFDLPMRGSWTLDIAVDGASAWLQMTVGTPGLRALGGGGSRPAAIDEPVVPPTELPAAALDAVRRAFDATERGRAELAFDRLDGVAAPAREAAQAIRAAQSALPTAGSEVANCLGQGVATAEQLANAPDLDAARLAFGELNRFLIALAAADPRLQDGWHVFSCPMAKGFKKWIQKSPTLENPYMGRAMPTCGGSGTWGFARRDDSAGLSHDGHGHVGDDVSHYTCSMHPSVRRDQPGTCPICSMDLSSVTYDEEESGVIMIDETRRGQVGIRTGRVVKAPMTRSIRAVGRVAYDETRLRDVTLKLGGWITKLHVERTGQPVKKGQLLFTLYSPELYAAQQEYLLAKVSHIDDGRGDYLIKAAERKLQLWGLSKAQVAAIAKRGEPLEDMPFYSPAGGYVIEKDVVEGAAVEAGQRLFRIAALDRVWVEAELYEADLALVAKGQRAAISLSYLPDKTYEGTVSYVYPYLDPASRTARVRVELANQGLELKPDMYATVAFEIDLGPRLQVPVDAIVYTGPRRLAFVDLGAGRLKPVEVTLGVRTDDVVEVRVGLHEGDIVVTSGNFLVAAESRIRSAAKIWSEERAGGGAVILGGVIKASARNPLLTILLVAGLAVWGWLSLVRAPLDAIPDLSDAQVIVFTEWMGRSPDLVEDQITYPISTSLLSAPNVKYVRGQSMFGMSFVYVIFEDGTDMYWARSRVLEYLNEAQARLPEGVTPTLGPDATGVGWVFEYAIVDDSGTHDLAQLRSIQDWNVRYALEGVEGVAEVASVGGFERQYQVTVDPVKLRAHDVMLHDVMAAIRRSNEDVGGQVIEIAGHEHVVRGRGYVKSLKDLETIPVKLGKDGVPIFVRDVGVVSLGPDARRGIAELDGRGEVAGGIVIMRYGENALDVIDAVKQRITEIERTLPEGVRIQVTYDRSGLIRASIATLRHTLIEEMVVVSIIIFLFLLHARSALIPILTIPLGILLAFVPMFYQGLTANIMSLGGIAVAIGAMVDASIILIENVHKKLEDWEHAGRPGDRTDVIIGAMQEVGPSIFFALLVITVAFIPVFTLEGIEGRLFKPLAFTKTYSMAFASILAVTLTPALAVLLIRGRIRGEQQNPINRWLIAGYTPVVRFVVRHRWTVIVGAVLAMVVTIPAYSRLGSEFMPPLNEGAILYMPTAPPGMSDAEASRVLQQMDRELRAFPEVESVFGKMGRAETATDPAPIGMVETVIVLKPRDQWRPGMTWDRLIREMDEQLQYPGMPNIWWMPIQTRTEMLSTGVRSPLGVQVFGDTLVEIEETAIAIEKALSTVPGTRSAFADRSTGGFYIDVVVKREEAARHGLTVGDVNDVVQTAIGGMNVSQTVEGRERYWINLRYPRELRDDPERLGDILVATPMGAQVPLSQVAEIKTVTGPPMIRSEDGRLVGFVFVDTDRPIADYVADAKRVVEREVDLPAGTRIEWVGQFKYLERARAKLKIVVPVTLLIVFLLLYLSTRSLIETGIVLLAVPFSLIGAIWLLYLLDYNMSVAVWVGLIALAGLDAETGVVMLLYLTLSHRRHKDEGRLRTHRDLEDAIVEGAAKRIRPKLMTVLTMMIGLVPVLWSTGTGADVMKRIAAPMVGGLVTSFLLELTVYPAIFAIWKRSTSSERAP